MAREIRQFAVTIPTGTTTTAPHKEQLTLQPKVVTRIRIRVPPGPRGDMGFAVGNAQKHVIPLTTPAWIVTDNDELVFTPTDYTTSGTWWVIGYNTGTYAHTIYLTFSLTTAPSHKGTPTPIPAATLSTTGFTGSGGAPVTSTFQATGVTVTPTPTPVTLPTLPSAPTLPTVSLPTVHLPTVPTVGTVALPTAPVLS